MQQAVLDQSHGTVQLRTGVTGRAARFGHRLTIGMTRWRGVVTIDGDRPTAVDLRVDVDSLEVQHGAGGAKGMSGPEKAIARGNALRSLDSAAYPEIRFLAAQVTTSEAGYRLSGVLTIRGVAQALTVDLTTTRRGEQLQLSCEATVVQTDFGIAPYSLMMGSLKVADEVGVSFAATYPVGLLPP